MPLTNAQKEKYIKNPKRCPLCNSDDIHVADRKFQMRTTIDQKAECLSCGTVFHEVFTLADVTIN